MVYGILIFFFICTAAAKAPYECGQKKIRKQAYGTVELRVECSFLEDETDNNISVLEFKGDVQHGVSIHYGSLWRKRDSSFFVDGKENGLCLFWDTLGNIVGRKTYKDGHYIGKRESFFAPGRPALIKHYNDQGEEEGPWEEWWKNGNKKAEYIARGGRIVSGKEYYQSGKPRAFYETKYEPKNMNVLKKKFIHAQAWAPNGKSTGRIVGGKGEWILFPDGKDTTDHAVFREVYKDSVMVEGKELDSAAKAKWLGP
jgi:hypothetical protein